MTKVIMSDGTEVPVQVRSQVGAFETQAGTGPQEIAAKLEDITARGAQFLRESVESMHTELSGITPDELTIEVGLGLTAEGSLLITKGKAEANITITATWHKP